MNYIKSTFKYGMSAERYDYINQAWIDADGRYIRCAHPEDMDCRCYGKLHAGEVACDCVRDKLCGCPVYSDCIHESETIQ